MIFSRILLQDGAALIHPSALNLQATTVFLRHASRIEAHDIRLSASSVYMEGTARLTADGRGRAGQAGDVDKAGGGLGGCHGGYSANTLCESRAARR